MNNSLLNRAVALATGEAASTIRRMGFILVRPEAIEEPTDLPRPQIVDWDSLEAQRAGYLPQRARQRRPA
jgi:hypothetical protein